ncbi:ferrous iron transporter B [Rhodoferax antarcticus]|uniref:Ferrous iron transport protein B n=1 Tax=Rhodoferax antarcticus ANT.BR TaxID=1111071 RepID=A0A1Q8YEN2_9BURK|nr:ferrous iron transporter B [Rhodoferax antarcticus]APW46235.1 ferrous iron transporter B [Rhodoferax antarcticus]MCW2313484.1 ferrous iron transport protein B [Rhodoferax antarcticus]OLP06435.1 ferrous iron transport protein B [Rhodoferax antarcticus ANT.BR]
MPDPLSERPLRVALLGNPNCGKTALFNLLTGSRQKVANYAGVTVERKEGMLETASGRQVVVLDLPGAYSLNALSADEQVTCDIVTGRLPSEPLPDLLVCVVDATNLRLNLRLVLEARALNLPLVLALNMCDAARHSGIVVDTAVLAHELGMPVIETVGIRHDGAQELLTFLAKVDLGKSKKRLKATAPWHAPHVDEVMATQQEVRRVLKLAVQEPAESLHADDTIDAVVLHPLWGMLVLAATLFLMFQAVFSLAVWPMDVIKSVVEGLSGLVRSHLTEGPLSSLLVDGVLAGAGGVLVFLPQILILFFFILVLEDSGYLPRAAFLLDRVMRTVGLSGRSFIPLLSSFACAVPGIMATRTITHWRDRLVTIMIAPLMTCSARLPVYTLLIGAFIPSQTVWGIFNLQGLVMFALYVGGILSAMAVAAVAMTWRTRTRPTPLVMELPSYRMPNLRSLAQGLYERGSTFVKRVGGIVLALTVLLWFLATYPAPPAGATDAAINHSYAGILGHWLEVLVAPIGFNWQIAVALVPGMAAREVVVGALGTVYALSGSGDDVSGQLAPLIAQTWSLATALSLLVWFIFAPQCISTLVVVRRETNSWRYPLLMSVYLFALAYVASWVTYRLTLAWTGG